MAIYTRNIASAIKYPFTFTSINKISLRNKYKHLQVNSTLMGVTYNIHTSEIFHKRRKTAEERKSPRILEYSKGKGDLVDVWRNITVGELAEVLNRDVNYVSDLFLGNVRGRNTVITDGKELHNAIRRAGKRMRFVMKPVQGEIFDEDKDAVRRPPPSPSELKPRPPVVTIMGHVDHGKTTLLDALRHSSIVQQEFGGITQHIGAFSVKLESGANVTFLDTPGHAAFSTMRARGANLTDIVVLVVAADDGVMEQTVESIRMAREAKVPILVAINKIDAPKADVKRTEQMLMERDIQVESLGGDIQCVHISALKKINLEQLTEALVVQAELMEVGGDPTGPVEAVVVDSRMSTHRGKLCTVIVQRGTLKKGDILVADTAMAKVKQLKDVHGNVLKEVGPGRPVEVEGWKDLPPAGEIVLEMESEKRAREVIRFRENQKETEKLEQDSMVIAEKAEQHQKEYKERLLLKRRLGRFRLKPEGPRKPEIVDQDGPPRLNLIIKTDVDGTLEAILEVLSTYHSTECEMDIVHYGVGAITENDIELAQTFNGVIYAFNVECPSRIKQQADGNNVVLKHHNVIYKLVDDVKEEINERLPQKRVEEVLGEAKVLQQFMINEGRKKVPVAGCNCEKGFLKRNSLYKVLRNGQTVHEGPLASMRYLKEEVNEIKTGSDCGLQFADKSFVFQPGDIVICYEHKMDIQKTDWDPGF